jgi:Copper type II ascorbate-dependent monooxygenase, C-terminal domain
MRHHAFLTLLSALTLLNCSSNPATEGSGGSGGTAAVDLLAPPAADEGVQYRMISTIESGQEIERCQLFVAPKEGFFVRKDEVRFTAGSHHVLLYRTPYTQLPTENLKGVKLDGTKIHDCADGATAEWDVNGVLAGSQSGDGDSMLGELPEGVAVKVNPGTVLVMNTHYLNASSEKVDADARINLYTLPPAQVKTEAGMLFYYNPFIHIPENGSATARMRCPVQQDISLVRVQSHMHRRGVGFAAYLGESDGSSPQEIYTSTEWERVPAKAFTPLLQIKAGQTIDYRCEYQNSEARTINQGLSTKDEMCMLIGPYYPRNEALEKCTSDKGVYDATWIGSGTATCSDSLGCLAGAKAQGDVYGCVVNSCPGSSNELSAFLRCQMSEGDGSCKASCPGADCESCVTTACGAALNTCLSAKCQ